MELEVPPARKLMTLLIVAGRENNMLRAGYDTNKSNSALLQSPLLPHAPLVRTTTINGTPLGKWFAVVSCFLPRMALEE